MSRLREFQRSTVSLEKSVFDDMLVRLEKMEQLEKKIQSLELELQAEKAKEADRILLCTKGEFEEWERQQGILAFKKHWNEFVEYTKNNSLGYSFIKSEWLEKWWEYECKREEDYQRELRKQQEREEKEKQEKQEELERAEMTKEDSLCVDDLVENDSSGGHTEQ